MGWLKVGQVLVVEAHPLAVLAVPGLELLGGLGVLDDRVDPVAAAPPWSRSRLRSSSAASSGVVGDPLGVHPHDLGPAVAHQVASRACTPVTAWVKLRTRSSCQPGFEALEPLDVGRAVAADTDRRRRALEDVELLGRLGQAGYGLHGGGTGADDADALVPQLLHRLARTAAGVASSPTGWCGTPDRRSPRCRGCPGSLALCRMPPAVTRNRGRQPVAAAGGDQPALGVVVPDGVGDLGLEQGVGVEVEVAPSQLAVLEDLRRAGVLLGGHVAGLFEQRQVGVATRRRTCSPGSGSSTRCRRSRRPSRRSGSRGCPAPGQVDGGEHAGEAAADDHHLGLLDDRRPG